MFKFYSIPNIETLAKIIGLNPTIRFSSAFDLNDPFELKFNLKTNFESKTLKEKFFKYKPNSSESEFENWKKDAKDDPNFLWSTEQEIRSKVAKRFRLCSFTHNNSNNLMWSHYTNNHEGICVEYTDLFVDYLISNTEFIHSNSVNYSEFPPTIDIPQDSITLANNIFFNKQIEWAYEQEFRIIIESDKDVDYIQFPHKFIKSVIIGSKASDKLVSTVINLCKPNGIKVLFGITLGDTYNVTFQEEAQETNITRSFWK